MSTRSGVIGLRQAPGLGDRPSVGCKQQDVCTGGVHLVGLARVDGLLLHSLNLQGIQLLVKYLAEVHDHRLVHLLPQVGPAQQAQAVSL